MEAVGQQSAPAAPLVFTDVAAVKVGELSNSALMLRVFISGGGCSGFQYGFTFDERREDGDTAIENAGVVLLVGGRDRLQRRPSGCPVYHPQPHCSYYLWMRIFILGLE